MNWFKRLFRRPIVTGEQGEMSVSYGLLEYEMELNNEFSDPIYPALPTLHRLGTLNAVLASQRTPGEPYITVHFPRKP